MALAFRCLRDGPADHCVSVSARSPARPADGRAAAGRDSYPMLLVANKVDLVHLRKVTEDQGRDLAAKLAIPYIETSAKDPPLNVDAAFHEVSGRRKENWHNAMGSGAGSWEGGGKESGVL